MPYGNCRWKCKEDISKFNTNATVTHTPTELIAQWNGFTFVASISAHSCLPNEEICNRKLHSLARAHTSPRLACALRCVVFGVVVVVFSFLCLPRLGTV